MININIFLFPIQKVYLSVLTLYWDDFIIIKMHNCKISISLVSKIKSTLTKRFSNI